MTEFTSSEGSPPRSAKKTLRYLYLPEDENPLPRSFLRRIPPSWLKRRENESKTWATTSRRHQSRGYALPKKVVKCGRLGPAPRFALLEENLQGGRAGG